MFDRLAVLVWKDKTKVVENNYVTEFDTTVIQLHVDGQNQLKNATCGRGFFGKGRKNLQVQTKPDT